MRIEFRRSFEGADRLTVIEGVVESESLIEELLRFGARRGNGMVQRAYTCQKRRWTIGSALRSVRMLRLGCWNRRGRYYEQQEPSQRQPKFSSLLPRSPNTAGSRALRFISFV